VPPSPALAALRTVGTFVACLVPAAYMTLSIAGAIVFLPLTIIGILCGLPETVATAVFVVVAGVGTIAMAIGMTRAYDD
jgi:hypothetical protein